MISNLYAEHYLEPVPAEVVGEWASRRAHMRNAHRYLSDLDELRDVTLLRRAGMSVRAIADVTTLTPYRVRQVLGSAAAGRATEPGRTQRRAEESAALAAVAEALDDPIAVARLIDRLMSTDAAYHPAGGRAGGMRGDPAGTLDSILAGIRRAGDEGLVTPAQLLRLTRELERRRPAGEGET